MMKARSASTPLCRFARQQGLNLINESSCIDRGPATTLAKHRRQKSAKIQEKRMTRSLRIRAEDGEAVLDRRGGDDEPGQRQSI